MDASVQSFNVPTGTVGTTHAISGLSFDPQIVIGLCAGRTESVDTAGRIDLKLSMGFGTSTSSRYNRSNQLEDAVGTTASDAVSDDTAILTLLTTAGAVDGKLDIQSFDSGGITFVVDDQFVAAYRFTILLIGGLESVSMGTYDEPAMVGNTDIDCGFAPDWVLMTSGYGSGSPGAGNSYTFGMAQVSGTIDQGVVAGRAREADATPNASGYGRGGDVAAGFSSDVTSVTSRNNISLQNANGFRINCPETSTRPYTWLAAKGGRVAFVEMLTQTDTATTFGSGSLGFAPKAGVLISRGKAEDASDTATADMDGCIGFFDSAETQHCQGWMFADGVDPTQASAAIESNRVYVNLDQGGSIEGGAVIDTLGTDSVTFIMDDADPSQFWISGIFFGDVNLGRGVVEGRLDLPGIVR